MKAFKTYYSCPENDIPDGIPLEWPWIVQDCEESEVEDLTQAGFQFASDEDYADYLAARQADFDAYEAAQPTICDDVTPRQIRLALILGGESLDSILAILNTLPEPQKSLALVEWEYAQVFVRSNPLVAQLAPLLGITDEELDQLWQLAATL